MTTEHPMIFNGAMVRAILSGAKTQTRRLVDNRNSWVNGTPSTIPNWRRLDFDDAFVDPGPSPVGNPGPYLQVARPDDETRHRIYPRVQPGDALWGRETWAHVPSTAYRCSDGVEQTEDPEQPGMAAVYAAGWERSPPGAWRPSIHMPRWASRLTLRVVGVRAERLNAISEADALAEGVRTLNYKTDAGAAEVPATTIFSMLWESIYGIHAWDADPWVWVYDFQREPR